ncbi:hypothetical protein EG329_002284 [Mollisiaceae sp. DMI_Dod_QoI]|nr:hypothetical protein EG329_002284 [Helotiales sp. DMI_Dod_QoI]
MAMSDGCNGGGRGGGRGGRCRGRGSGRWEVGGRADGGLGQLRSEETMMTMAMARQQTDRRGFLVLVLVLVLVLGVGAGKMEREGGFEEQQATCYRTLIIARRRL